MGKILAKHGNKERGLSGANVQPDGISSLAGL